jgi:hemerythrin-like domain-containing protein
MSENNAVVLLEDDHERLKDLLRELSQTTERAVRGRIELLADIASAIKAHSTIEEEIFYPAFKAAAEKKEDEKLFYEAQEEHHIVDVVLQELEGASPASAEFAAKAKVLQHLVLQHIAEEEGEMFPRARRILRKPELARLAEEMQQRRTELLPLVTRA